MTTKTIKQEVIIKARPHDVFEAILNPRKHSKFTGGKATNNMKVGGKFTAYDDYISGENLVIQQDKKIVQKWTSSDFPEGVFTEVTFEFKPEGFNTKLIFTQKNVPEDLYEELEAGWEEFYWIPLKAFLEDIM